MLTRRDFLGTAAAAAADPRDAPHLVRLERPRGPLVAYIAPEHGGELAGLAWRDATGDRELLYRGRDYATRAGWTGRAPILWPATGRNLAEGVARQGDGEDGSWRWKGRVLAMPIHGFARDRPWTVEATGRAGIRLSLRDDAATRRGYPFGFRLETRYDLAGASLAIRQQVVAAPDNADVMPFSIGNHITFGLPLVPGGDPSRVTIATPATRRIMLDSAGKPTGEIMDAPFRTTPLAALPARTAVALSGYAPDATWARLDDPAGLAITVSHRASSWPEGDPVLFNLWGDVQAGFFSPEPWVGKQGSLASGDGLIRLAPGHAWRWTITVEVQGARTSL